jgi:hypothetical protein
MIPRSNLGRSIALEFLPEERFKDKQALGDSKEKVALYRPSTTQISAPFTRW